MNDKEKFNCDEPELTFDSPVNVSLIGNLSPAYIFTLYKGDKEIGRMDFSSGKMEFSGDMEESAKVFFDYLKETIIDPYLERKEKEKGVR